MPPTRTTQRVATSRGHVVRAIRWTTIIAMAAPAFAQPDRHNGRLEKIGSFRVLRVWGEPDEMGFAHGFLVGKDIVSDLNVIIPAFFNGDVQRYEQSLPGLRQFINIPDRPLAEIKGIFRGITEAAGAAPEVPVLKRPLTLDDLIWFNALDVLRAFGCSGFTVWGDRAGEFGVITARNFDFTPFAPTVVEHHLILVREPAGRHRVMSITFPGYVGAFTAINDAGAAVFIHDGSAPSAEKPDGRYRPLVLAIQEILETSEPDNVFQRARDELARDPSPFSYMVRVVIPFVPAAPAPVVVLRTDPTGVGVNPIREEICITTNHYLNDAFQPPSADYPNSTNRYRILESRVGEIVTPETAWQALAAVAVADTSCGTLHSLVYLPERRRIDLAFATWQGSFVPATRMKPVSIAFGELFPEPHDRRRR
ncbi:MAG: hypothetical protein HOP29_13495 [Phycisphaerales bacterium]|nr:hypothetical protein [Phycisphaerales bacterium]